jgi:hypothetical protein
MLVEIDIDAVHLRAVAVVVAVFTPGKLPIRHRLFDAGADGSSVQSLIDRDARLFARERDRGPASSSMSGARSAASTAGASSIRAVHF